MMKKDPTKMQRTYTELLKESISKDGMTDYIWKLLTLFSREKISIDVCYAELDSLIDGVIEKTGDLNSKAIKRQRKKIADLERKIEIYKKYSRIPTEDVKENPYHETLNGFTFLLSIYRTVIANTGEVWVREVSNYRPEVDFYNHYGEENYLDHRNKIACVLENESTCVEEKKHLLYNIFDAYEKNAIVLPVLEKEMQKEDMLIRNIAAYSKYTSAIFNALMDLKKSELPHSYRIYAGVVSKYFLKNVGTSKQQLIWYKDHMQKTGDTVAQTHSRKTLDRNIKVGIAYMLHRYNHYIDEYVKNNPDVVLCIQKARGLIDNHKANAEYFWLPLN